MRARHPGYTIETTGLSVIAARNSAEMIGKLNRALTVEFVFVAAFVGLASAPSPWRRPRLWRGYSQSWRRALCFGFSATVFNSPASSP